MRRAAVCLIVVALVLAISPSPAQAAEGTIARIATWDAKPGMKEEMEKGIKKHMEWHRKQNDSWDWFTWETVTGENTGRYGGGTFDHQWADFDTPSVPEEEDRADADATVFPYIENTEIRFYSLIRDVSRPDEGGDGVAMNSVITFQVRAGRDRQFNHLIKKFHEAIGKTEWPVRYSWFALVNGGRGGQYVLVLPRGKWADFAPLETPFEQMLEEAYGRVEADSILEAWGKVIEESVSEIVSSRPDLSYVPGSND